MGVDIPVATLADIPVATLADIPVATLAATLAGIPMGCTLAADRTILAIAITVRTVAVTVEAESVLE